MAREKVSDRNGFKDNWIEEGYDCFSDKQTEQ